MAIPMYSGEVPSLSTAQMIEVDGLMIEEYRIELIQMMENAGRNLAHLARVRFLGGDPSNKKIIVAAGSGGNGGGALVCARHLANWGADVWIALTRPGEAFSRVPAHQLDILERMDAPMAQAEEMSAIDAGGVVDLIVDGVIGYSLSGAPRGSAARLIHWANEQRAPILALDTPSGLDATSGTASDPTIRATATLTLALPKLGLRAPEAEAYTGELYLTDISVPPTLYADPSVGVMVGPLFAENDIIRLA
jgi:NAD(P)H-hydrate epimerase